MNYPFLMANTMLSKLLRDEYWDNLRIVLFQSIDAAMLCGKNSTKIGFLGNRCNEAIPAVEELNRNGAECVVTYDPDPEFEYTCIEVTWGKD